MKSWDKFNIDFTHVHEAGGNTFVSKIDHFFWNEGLSENINDAGVLGHVPIAKNFYLEYFCFVEFIEGFFA